MAHLSRFLHFRQPLALILSLLMYGEATGSGVSHKSFANPPQEALPWVYLFPLDGNITSNGITADLEAMKRAKIGGLLYMETDQGAPRGPAKFAGPLWRSLFQHLCAEARRLDLEVNMNNDAGWCGSGGPWITPELSMQQVVWTETQTEGPKEFNEVLEKPQANRDYYRDIAVFAYPTPAKRFVIPGINGKSAKLAMELVLHASYPELPAESVVARGQIREITSKLAPDGRLTWSVPSGRWTILRMGHTSTGKDNHPAPVDGRGLECDKLSKQAAEVHFKGLMGKLIADNKALTGTNKTLVSTHIDSWEVGSQNWTPKFREDFRRLRGYDPMPLLPVMTGCVVDNLEVSERFLWDIRLTVSELLCDNYAGHFRTLAHQNGIRLSIEAYDGAPSDHLAYAGRADEPMAEFWSWGINDAPIFAAYSCPEMTSAAHVYGRPIVGAEAFTATDKEKWQGHPSAIKALGDWAFCEGINRFVFHRYALQPWTNPDRPPGMSMGPWGLHYERTQTWWEMSRAWHEYLSRCQYMLQRGLFVADICFLTPENSPQRFKSPVKTGYDRPGYNFDACPPDALLSRISVKDNRLVLPDGMSYRMLMLPRVETMTPTLLRKIRDLANAGAIIVGGPPKKSPSLANYPACDEEVQALARELWGESPTAGGSARVVGKGRVIYPAEYATAQQPYKLESALQAAKWIWFNESRRGISAPPGTRYFRRILDLGSSEISSAILQMAADNTFECFVNSRLATEGVDWHQARQVDIRSFLKPGKNVVAVRARNLSDAPNPAGLIGAIEIKYQDGKSLIVRTDRSWEAVRDASDDWMASAANNSQWTAAMELGAYGMQPWNEVTTYHEGLDTTVDISVPAKILSEDGVPPDFAASVSLRYIHKKMDEADVYFVANPKSSRVEAVCTFRVEGKQPELWWPDSGRIESARAYESVKDCTTLPLRLEPADSVFVVFAKSLPKRQPSAGANWTDLHPAQQINGPWTVTFDPKWGGPATPIRYEALEDWTKSSEPGIRHYSGTAVYETTFNAKGTRGPSYIDLGKVSVMAEVLLNGKNLGIAWKPPFRLEATHALKQGKNTLEVRVVNLWINRMIGDESLPEDSDRNPSGNLKSWPDWLESGKPSPAGRYTFTSWRLWKKDDPLAESGLLGPVTLQIEE